MITLHQDKRYHRWSWSAAELLVVDDAVARTFCTTTPLSAGIVTPHLPSDSKGSMTLTVPSVNPTAN